MYGRIPELRHRGEVLSGGVPLVLIEAVPGVARVQCTHVAVSADFGQDGRRRNRRASPVAPNDRALGHHEIRDEKAVDEDEIRKGNQLVHRVTHRAQRCLMHVDPIDLGGFSHRQRPREGPIQNLVVEPLAGFGRQQFGVANTANRSARVEHDGRDNDGTGQTATADFIDARDAGEAQSTYRVLDRS